MPRRAKPPRLIIRTYAGCQPTWYIRYRGKEESTGCPEGDLEGAERELESFLSRKHEPKTTEKSLSRITCADVINLYVTEHAPNTKSHAWIVHTATPAGEWWGDKTLADIRGQTCRQYVKWRCGQGVSEATARHDLKTFRAAINYYHREYGPLDAVPVLTLPPKPQPRERWLTRSEAAKLLWHAYRGLRCRHTVRLILIGLYTGTRPGAVMRLRWMPSTDSGWVDLESGVIFRRGEDEKVSKKRATPAQLNKRLLAHLRRWKRMDEPHGITHVCHYYGRACDDAGKSFAQARKAAGLDRRVTPHILRHTCVTWLLRAGVNYWDVGGFVGMSPETVLEVYGHHSPDSMGKAASAL